MWEPASETDLLVSHNPKILGPSSLMQLPSSQPSSGLSRTKSTAFALIAIAFPFIVILIVEAALRLAGVGAVRREPFQPVPGQPAYVAIDPDFGSMFFRGFRPNVGFDPIAAAKDTSALRVVALGGSTTAGFPYHWYNGFPARLEDRLAAALPGRLVEVANLGMTATNSFTIWALAESVVEQRPDAVVIYAGHNEYYGAFGTAGTQGWTGSSVRFKRLLIGASRWAILAGVEGLIRNDELPAAERRTMMARVVRDAAIEPNSEAFHAGIAQFEANLRSTIQRFERAGIPVFLGTLTSNLADQAPLGDDAAALAAYDRGRELLAAGDTTSARAAFLQAREADGLRFRAPEAVNDVVRRLAQAFKNVTLVDVEERFRMHSPGGIEGASLFADHLHPNARGYALMADAYFTAMQSSLQALHQAPDPGPAPADLDAIEERFARLQITILTSGYPFRKDRTPAEAEATARGETDAMSRSGHYADELTVKTVLDGMPMMNALDAAGRRAREDADTLAGLHLYRALLYWQPFNATLMEQAVSFGIQNSSFDAETAVLARYVSIHTDNTFSLNALAAIALRQGDLARAATILEAVERVDARSPEMLFNRARLLVMQGDTTNARRYFERYRAVAHP